VKGVISTEAESESREPKQMVRAGDEASIFVEWVSDQVGEKERQQRAYELAALLVEAPVHDLQVVDALRARGGLGANRDATRTGSASAETCEPFSYRLVGDYIAELPPMRQARGLSGSSRETNGGGDGGNGVRGRGSRRMTTPSISPSPPPATRGAGGRQSKSTPYSQTSATADLIALLGLPEERSYGACKMLVWVNDPAGDGIIVARLSDRDIQSGETAMSQVHGAFENAKRLGLTPRLIIVCTNLSGANMFRDRPDLQLITEEIDRRRCRWVHFRGVDRIARRAYVFYQFIEMLMGAGTKLYLNEISGRAVDWETDDIHLGFNSLMSERERITIYKRTHGPLITRWLGEGRGWPGGLPFGFKRNPVTKFAEICPIQWRAIRIIFFTYALHEDGKGGGVRAVEKELREYGYQLSRESIRRILKKSIYLDGRWTSTRAGQVVENRQIEIPEHLRIPSDVYARSQRFRRLRKGKDTVAPPGFFALNPVIEFTDGTRLRARIEREGFPANEYYYRPWVARGKIPKPWLGVKIPMSKLHRAIAAELRRIASCHELQKQFTEIARPEFNGDGSVLDEAGRRDLKTKIANLERTRDALTQDYVSRFAEEGPENIVNPLAGFETLTAGVTADIDRYREQLGRAEALDELRRTTRPAENAELLDLLHEVCPLELPTEPEAIEKFATFVELALSKIVVDIDEYGDVLLWLHGPLVPADLPLLRMHDPLTVLGDEIAAGSDGLLGALIQPTHKGSVACQLDRLELPRIGTRNPEKPTRERAFAEERPAWISTQLEIPGLTIEVSRMEYDWNIVLRICHLRGEEWSLARIAALFNDEDVPAPRGGTWSEDSLCRLLRNLRQRRHLPAEVREALEVTRVARHAAGRLDR
jgi:DNA invertase Pin-like site-specific DNA recombinase